MRGASAVGHWPYVGSADSGVEEISHSGFEVVRGAPPAGGIFVLGYSPARCRTFA